jgi:hypothetical protein
VRQILEARHFCRHRISLPAIEAKSLFEPIYRGIFHISLVIVAEFISAIRPVSEASEGEVRAIAASDPEMIRFVYQESSSWL